MIRQGRTQGEPLRSGELFEAALVNNQVDNLIQSIASFGADCGAILCALCPFAVPK